jgi:hypothetical protein
MQSLHGDLVGCLTALLAHRVDDSAKKADPDERSVCLHIRRPKNARASPALALPDLSGQTAPRIPAAPDLNYPCALLTLLRGV